MQKSKDLWLKRLQIDDVLTERQLLPKMMKESSPGSGVVRIESFLSIHSKIIWATNTSQNFTIAFHAMTRSCEVLLADVRQRFLP